MAVSIRSVRAVRPSARVASVRPAARPVSRVVARAEPVSYQMSQTASISVLYLA